MAFTQDRRIGESLLLTDEETGVEVLVKLIPTRFEGNDAGLKISAPKRVRIDRLSRDQTRAKEKDIKGQ